MNYREKKINRNLELPSTITEMEYSLKVYQWIWSDRSKNQWNWRQVVEIIHYGQQRKKNNEQKQKDLEICEKTIKYNKISIKRVLKEEKREIYITKIQRNKGWKFSKFMKNTNIDIQKAQETPHRKNSEIHT